MPKTRPTPEEQLASYSFLKIIGRGQFGVVQLVRCKTDNKLYVCKIIDLGDLGDAERDGSLQEVPSSTLL